MGQLQLQMLRQLHGLGPSYAMSLRLVKDEALTLYLVFRYAGPRALQAREHEQAERSISSALMPNVYSFERLDSDEAALDVSWAREAVEVYRREGEFSGAPYPTGDAPRSFYVPFMWQPTDNTMERLCDALMAHAGRACVEVTLVPTDYLPDEQGWMSVALEALRDSVNGEEIRDANGRLLLKLDKLPALRPALENCERLNKQFLASRLFLSSVHVFADASAQSLANALMTSCVRNEGETHLITRTQPAFSLVESSYAAVDVPVDLVSAYWHRHLRTGDAPLRAQRMQRLVSVEEAGTFFRIPIPSKAGFPGFGLDTGLGDVARHTAGSRSIGVGRYLDVAGGQNEASFDVQQLAKHGLVVGVPGSGKTTALFSVLHQLWDAPPEERVPFIVLEPAKTEYRALKTLPAFARDMLVFTLGDEDTSPFRFNPLEVLPGIRLESHISRLQACFVGAFDLFDPLPIFLEQAIRRTYAEKGWYDDSRGGEPGLVTPSLADLCRNASHIVEHSGFDAKMRSDFKASLLERLNSLRRGSKGRMLDCASSIPMDELMERPVVLELDSLNGDEKSLMMMFLLSYVFEYCKARRHSGSPLRHVLVVEEAHNLIGAQGSSANRADPRAQAIELFINMLAEMRALGQGILIADQLPTAIAAQAVKQTNVKLLMRVTARDDREEIGNTMDLNEEQMHQVVNFKTGHAYLYHEGEDMVRMVRLPNFKGDHEVQEPPSDAGLKRLMASYELERRTLYLPFEECAQCCEVCDRRVRNQAQSFVSERIVGRDVYGDVFGMTDRATLDALRKKTNLCGVCLLAAKREAKRIEGRYERVGSAFGHCVYVHLLHEGQTVMNRCARTPGRACGCEAEREHYLQKFKAIVGEDKHVKS